MPEIINEIHIHHHDHHHGDLDEGRLADAVESLSERITRMALDLTELRDAVAENTAVDQSAIQLLTTLLDEVESLKGDPEAIQALVNDIRASNATLGAAVAAGTPVDPGGSPEEPTPAPEPEPTPDPGPPTEPVPEVPAEPETPAEPEAPVEDGPAEDGPAEPPVPADV